jgi:hypothetical protein
MNKLSWIQIFRNLLVPIAANIKGSLWKSSTLIGRKKKGSLQHNTFFPYMQLKPLKNYTAMCFKGKREEGNCGESVF